MTTLLRTFAVVGCVLALGWGPLACSDPQPDPVVEEPPAPSGPPLRYGVLPAVKEADIAGDYAEMAKAMGQAVDRPVEVVVGEDYDTLVDQLVKGELHAAQLSAYLYAKVKASSESPLLIAQQRSAADTQYHGVFVVKKDSTAKSLADLKGKSLAYVHQSSASGYFYPRIKLRAAELDPDAHFGNTTFAGSHAKVVEAVKTGESDAGVISEQTMPDAMGLRVLEKTDAIPDDAVVTVKGLSDEEREKLTAFFLGAHEVENLQLFFNQRGIERYVRADPTVYAAIEAELGLTTEVGAGDADEEPPAKTPAKEKGKKRKGKRKR